LNYGDCNALQIEAADAEPVILHFKGEDRAKFEAHQPIHSCLMAFLLLIPYHTLSFDHLCQQISVSFRYQATLTQEGVDLTKPQLGTAQDIHRHRGPMF